jgi:hypothetical protein
MSETLVDRARSRLYGIEIDKKALECPRCGGVSPRCEFYNGWCGHRADWSVWVPHTWKPPLRLTPKFACNECLEFFRKAWDTPIKGIDRPEGADEDWRPSLMDMMKHARIAIEFERRNERPSPDSSEGKK